MDEHVVLKGDHIKLGALLKFAGAVSSGGEAKEVISEGLVKVNGSVSFERGKKIRAGDQVEIDDTKIFVDGEKR